MAALGGARLRSFFVVIYTIRPMPFVRSVSTKFKFNRFGLTFAAPRDVSQLTGLKKPAATHSAGVNGFIAGVIAQPQTGRS